jgi:hypothetical protein
MAEGAEEAVNFAGGTWRGGAWTGDMQADWATQALAIMTSKPFVQSVCWQQLADGTASGGVGDEMPGGGMIGAGGTTRPILSRVAQIRQALREGKGTAGFVNLGVF